MGSIAKLISNIGQKALIASNTLRIANTDTKNNALLNIAAAIQENKQTILDENSLDIEIAKKNNKLRLLKSIDAHNKRPVDIYAIESLPSAPVQKFIDGKRITINARILTKRALFSVACLNEASTASSPIVPKILKTKYTPKYDKLRPFVNIAATYTTAYVPNLKSGKIF